MAIDANSPQVNRRGFLKGAAAGAAGAAAATVSGIAATDAEVQLPDQARVAFTPEQAAQTLAPETAPLPDEPDVMTVEDPGSDFMVDVLKKLDFEFIAANPASSFRGLHESFINYGGNTAPEWITCCHEQASVNIANGYYAVAGKPMAVITFAPSGLHHAMMGIFGAFSAHTPTYLLVANILDGKERRPAFDWGPHSVVDPEGLQPQCIRQPPRARHGVVSLSRDRRPRSVQLLWPASSDDGLEGVETESRYMRRERSEWRRAARVRDPRTGRNLAGNVGDCAVGHAQQHKIPVVGDLMSTLRQARGERITDPSATDDSDRPEHAEGSLYRFERRHRHAALAASPQRDIGFPSDLRISRVAVGTYSSTAKVVDLNDYRRTLRVRSIASAR